jgi:phospholipid transport system substrate-binding protein
MSISRTLRSTFAALLLIVVPVMATAKEKAAEQYIDGLAKQVLMTISQKDLAKEKKQAALDKLFRENVDFDWVAKFVMGRFWRQATDDQKKRYVEAYKAFLIRNYTARFLEYTSGSFKVLGSQALEKGESVVNMEIASEKKGEPPILIDYKVRHGSSHKIFDIIVEGVSLLTTQRSEFNSVLNKSGIDGLIAQLEAK